jgi:hypothetical protein
VSNDRSTKNRQLGPLAEGQIWKMKDECLAIKHVGRYLVECTITKKPSKRQVQKHARGFKQLLSINEVEKFLHDHKAVLSHT